MTLVLSVITTDGEQLTSIRQIDFKNFTYVWGDRTENVPLTWQWLTSSPKLRLRAVNGIRRFYDPGQDNYPIERAPLIRVDWVTYGDLDGDGVEEAVVALNYSTGGTANWDYLYVYKLENGQTILLARMEAGSRGYGGLVKASVRDRLLIVDFADAERRVGDCCSKGYIRVRYRWQKGRFIEEGVRERGDLELHEGPVASALANAQAPTWKSFSNRAGWSIGYPADWTIASCKSCSDPAAPEVFVDFFPPRERGAGWVMIEHLAEKPSSMSADDWLADIKRTANQNPQLSEERFALDGLPALKVRYRNPSGGGYEMETVYVVSGAQTFAIGFSGDVQGFSVATSENYPTYLEMVKTFKVKR